MMESIAPADVSLPNTPDTEMVQIARSNPYSIFSLFPPAKSSTGTPSSNQTLPLAHFSPSIPSFFPPENSPSISLSPYLLKPKTSLLIPYHHSFHPTTLSQIHQHVVNMDLKFPYPQSSSQTIHILLQLSHPDITNSLLNLIFRSLNLYGALSVLSKWFYNVEDHKFNNKALTLSFFQFMESWSNLIFGSVLSQVFSTSSLIWVVGKDCLKGSKYYRAREGRQYGLKTMCCIRVADGVTEFGSTELIHPP